MPEHDDQPQDPRIAFFDRIAVDWDEAEQDPAETIRRVEQETDLLALQRGDDLLEVGCGTAQLTEWLADRVRPGRVVAVDFSPRMLERARAKAPSAAEFRLIDVCRQSPGVACFDVALCFHSFPHFQRQDAAAAYLAASLKPGGRLLVMHLNSRADVNAFHDQVGREVAGDHLPDDQQWDRLLVPFGLHVNRQIDRPGLYFLEAKAQG
jgi:ubiquinone/menaquinone biosynthesis C-methylase UbiE